MRQGALAAPFPFALFAVIPLVLPDSIHVCNASR